MNAQFLSLTCSFRLQPEERKRRALSSREATPPTSSTKELDDSRPPSAPPEDITTSTRDSGDSSAQESTSVASLPRPVGAAVVPGDRDGGGLGVQSEGVAVSEGGGAVDEWLRDDERATVCV